jgi:phosphodiesterase/alkaline phosphatase D-like protein
MREAFERNLEQPAQQRLFLNVPIAYVWDDHDFGGNDSSAVADSRFASRDVYGDYVPHYPLQQAGPVAISQAFTLGRVRFILLDTRSARTPDDMPDGPDKTMLGSAQVEWFKRELLRADGQYPLIVVVSSVPWISQATEGADDWGGFATERREIANFISSNGIDGVVLFGGDAHMLAIDDGANSDYSDEGQAALPVFQAGALDRRGTAKGGPYSEGEYPGGGQFGVMTVTDTGGSSITVQWTGMNWKGETIVAHTFKSPSATK